MATKFIQKYPVPPNFQELLRDFTMEILRDQPDNIYEYGAKYFGAIDDGVEFYYEQDQQEVVEQQEASAAPDKEDDNEVAEEASPKASPEVERTLDETAGEI